MEAQVSSIVMHNGSKAYQFQQQEQQQQSKPISTAERSCTRLVLWRRDMPLPATDRKETWPNEIHGLAASNSQSRILMLHLKALFPQP